MVMGVANVFTGELIDEGMEAVGMGERRETGDRVGGEARGLSTSSARRFVPTLGEDGGDGGEGGVVVGGCSAGMEGGGCEGLGMSREMSKKGSSVTEVKPQAVQVSSERRMPLKMVWTMQLHRSESLLSSSWEVLTELGVNGRSR